MGFPEIIFLAFIVVGIISMTILWHGPRNIIMKADSKSLFETYKGNQPPRKLLSPLGRIVENIFYISGFIALALVLGQVFFR